MRHALPAAAVLALTILSPAAPAAAAAGTSNWPDFRGPARNGHAAPDARPPTTWSDTERVKWTTPIPGQGHSSPVVWGDRVWLTTAVGGGKSMRAICADARTGRLLHDVEVFTTGDPGPKHDLNSFASPSPAVEDGRVYVGFGTHGVACLDAATAEPVWTNRDFALDFLTGAGSSPVLYKDLLILECDAVNDQYVLALDKRTGKPAWKTPRSKRYNPAFPAKRRAFSTAVVEHIGGRDVLLSVGAQRAYGYDPATGRELWYVDHGGYSNVARPLWHDGLLIFSTGYDKPDLVAVRVPQDLPRDGKPVDLTSRVAWRQKQGAPNKPSPTLAGGRLYVAADTGVARCLDPGTGDVLWTKRLGQTYSASPVYAGGHLYFLSEKGQVHVLKAGAGKEAEVASEFTTAEGHFASPAVVGDALILRSTGHLYRVE